MDGYRRQVYCCMLLNDLIEPCVTTENIVNIRDILRTRLHELIKDNFEEPIKFKYMEYISNFINNRLENVNNQKDIGWVLKKIYDQVSFKNSKNSEEYKYKCRQFVTLEQLQPIGLDGFLTR